MQHLKDLYPKLSMENVYFLYSNNDIDKINWEKVEKCGNLGIFFWECKLFLNDTEVDLNLLEDLKKAGVNFAEQDIISKKWGKRGKIEENKEQILQNLADIKKYLSIQKFNVGYLFDDFLMRKLSLDFDKLQELQEQGRKFECSHLRALNGKPILMKRWEKLQEVCDIEEMVKINNMPFADYLREIDLMG